MLWERSPVTLKNIFKECLPMQSYFTHSIQYSLKPLPDKYPGGLLYTMGLKVNLLVWMVQQLSDL